MSRARNTLFAIAAVIVLVPPSPEARASKPVYHSLGEAIAAVRYAARASTAARGTSDTQTGATIEQQAYLKASNTLAGAEFGFSVAISGDTAVVGAHFESNSATGVNGNQHLGTLGSSGAAYVFVRGAGGWSQQAYLKASNTRAAANFGEAVAISGDTIVVGSPAAAVPPSLVSTGAAYVFVRSGASWSQQALLSASNRDLGDQFGKSVAISGDTIVVGAHREASAAAGVNANQNDNSALQAGAAYVFVRDGSTWAQQAYLKASNPAVDDMFGFSVGISGDTVIVGAWQEDSNATGVGGDQSNNSASLAGAAYVFARSGTTWTQQAYLKASNTFQGQHFGYSVSVSGDTAVVGSRLETSLGTGVNGDQTPNRASAVGAAYVFERSGETWSQHSYLKASNAAQFDQFGYAVAISGHVIVVGAIEEDSSASGADGNQADNSLTGAGAAYVFVRSGGVWSQHAYLKSSNPGLEDSFGNAVAVSGGTILIGAYFEWSNATGVNGNEADNSSFQAGAAYLFEVSNTAPTIITSPITRWPATSGNVVIGAVDDAEDGPGFLELSVESANPSNGVTLSGLANVAGTVTADIAVEAGASSASFMLRVSDVWGRFSEAAYDVTVRAPVVITPNILPAPNAAGWHNGPVTVSWTIANGVPQSGCDPTILSTDTTTAGTTVTCTAGNDGGSKSASTTIKIDRTAPVGTASRTPPPNANGWNNTDVLVTFTCADTLSGPVSPGAAETIGTEGGGQSRAFSCVDLAGNIVPLAVSGVNIDKTAPAVVPASVTATPNPAMVNTAIALSANVTDTGSSGLALAEYKIGAGAYASFAPASGSSATAAGSIGAIAAPSVLELCVRAVDRAGNQGPDECILLAVFDPSAGYVTGAGTIESPSGALVGSTAAGTARFGFQSKYARGAAVPTGSTQFKFRAGNLEFDSTAYEWLVVAGARAQYKGTGVIRNTTGTFDFLLTVIDGDQAGGGGADKFRIKISGPGGVIYDNQMEAADSADPSTVIASGHIVIRK